MTTRPPPGPPTGALSLIALPPDGSAPVSLPLRPEADGACRFRLACLPGADAIHLEAAVDGHVRLRAEVRAQAGDRVRCTLRLDAEGEPVLEAGHRQVFFLALGPGYAPLPPLPPPGGETGWDLCVLVDATTRTSAGAAPPGPAGPDGRGHPEARAVGAPPALDAFLLEQPDQWQAIVGAITALARRLDPGGTDTRCAVIAFGDEDPPPGIHAPELLPAFHLRHLPEDRPGHALVPMTPEALARVLGTGIRPSPGGDFVDALADALAAASALQWGEERRRLLILIGDSPGHSVAHPVPWGGDALPRRADTDAEVARLHRDHRVEVLTLYHPPPPALERTLLEDQAALVRHARAQYRRLAATPALAFTTDDFDPARAAALLRERRDPLGRGPCWGRLIEEAPEG